MTFPLKIFRAPVRELLYSGKLVTTADRDFVTADWVWDEQETGEGGPSHSPTQARMEKLEDRNYDLITAIEHALDCLNDEQTPIEQRVDQATEILAPFDLSDSRRKQLVSGER